MLYILKTSRPTHGTSPQGLSLLPGVALAPKMLEMLKCCSIVCFLDNDSDHRFLLCVENISDCLSQENHQNQLQLYKHHQSIQSILTFLMISKNSRSAFSMGSSFAWQPMMSAIYTVLISFKISVERTWQHLAKALNFN